MEMARIELQATLPKVLDPVQLQLLPGIASFLYKTKSAKGNRAFIFGAPN